VISWIVVLSDERSEESKEPYDRRNPRLVVVTGGHTVISRQV